MKYNKYLEERKKEIIKTIGKCEKCGRPDGGPVKLTVDHIIPVDILLLLGLDKPQTFDEDNFAVLCKVCNNFKNNKLDFADPRTKLLMNKYMARL
jgi:5-methylcytosine-specific restriction endonuclease McrA